MAARGMAGGTGSPTNFGWKRYSPPESLWFDDATIFTGFTTYVHPDHLKLLLAAQKGQLQANYSTLLSPFDPLVWDRERALALFNFDYRIECYTPEARRKFGYFCLPILVRGALVGRLDAKAHRAERVFEIKALYLEPGVSVDEMLVADIADVISRCARWHQTPNVKVTQTAPPRLRHLLRRALVQHNQQGRQPPVGQ